MGFDEQEGHCFFERQPQTEVEIYQAVQAVWASDIQALRYAGNDPEILRRLAELGEAEACDQPPPTGSTRLLRNQVTFEASFAEEPSQVAAALRNHLLARTTEGNEYEVTHQVEGSGEVWFAVFFSRRSWIGEQPRYDVWAGHGEPGTRRWLVRHSPAQKPASIFLSFLIHDWLRVDGRFGSIRWYTDDAWRKQAAWQETPY